MANYFVGVNISSYYGRPVSVDIGGFMVSGFDRPQKDPKSASDIDTMVRSRAAGDSVTVGLSFQADVGKIKYAIRKRVDVKNPSNASALINKAKSSLQDAVDAGQSIWDSAERDIVQAKKVIKDAEKKQKVDSVAKANSTLSSKGF